VEDQQGRPDQGGGLNQFDFVQFRTPGTARRKTDAQVAYGVGFGRSIYGWKQNFIELPMAPVSYQNSS
jgi:hypothetical protein